LYEYGMQMKTITIITATSGNNKSLAQDLNNILDKTEVKTKIINLEDLEFPLYKPPKKENLKQISILHDHFVDSQALIFCAPEYNGGSPPVLSNAITWLSVSSADWRECFDHKFVLIATYSGGPAYRFLSGFRVQLEYLGAIVYPRTISVSKEKPLNLKSAEKILSNFIKHL